MNAEKEFINYITQFGTDEKIKLRRDHTFRVVSLCEIIAKSLNMSQKEIDLAKLCGLLHDIGRFEQIKKYNSFNDLTTLDHGNAGEIILKKDNLIDMFTHKNQDTILRTVKYHNKYRVPDTLNEKNKLFVNIIRDADKIDILYSILRGDISLKPNNSIVSEKVYNGIFKKKMIKNKDIKTPADELISRLAYIFDINYKESYKIIKRNDYVNKITQININETNNKKLINQLKEIRDIINNYIEEMLQC